MIDAVYVLGPGSVRGDLELAASAWSLRKHVRNVRDIFVFGETPRPQKYPKFKLRPVEPFGRDKQHRAQTNLLAAMASDELTEEILLMNDDFFFVRDVDATSYPFYSAGPLEPHVRWRMENDRSNYSCALEGAYRQLLKAGLPTFDYETHSPIRYERQKMRATFEKFKFDLRVPPVFKSLYANHHGVTPTIQPGCKISTNVSPRELAALLADRDCFTVGDDALNYNCTTMLNLLKGYIPC